MHIGYARVSTQDQDARAQVEALEKSGCELIFQEKISGGRWDRPELHRMLKQLRKGDVVIVWKLDRLSRSLIDVLNLMEMINRAKAGFRSLTEAIDTTTPAGRMMMQMVGHLCRVRARDAERANPPGSGCCPQTGADRRPPPKADGSSARRDSPVGSVRQEDRSRRGQALQCAPGDHLPNSEAVEDLLNQFSVPLLPKPRHQRLLAGNAG